MSDECLQTLLLDRLNRETAANTLAVLAESGQIETVNDLLSELNQFSGKLAGEAVWALPEFQRRCGVEVVIPWLDLGIMLSQASGAMGLRYFKESPFVLGMMESQEIRRQVLTLTLEMADHPVKAAPNCALEFFKKAPELLMEVPVSELEHWSEVGLELAQWDFVLGYEFFRESPSIAHVIPQESVRTWITFAMKLVSQNHLGKPDYLGTLEFFRTSPALLGDLPDWEVIQKVIDIGSGLADRSPAMAISFLANSPQLLRGFPSPDWRLRVLRYGCLVADRDAEAFLSYMRRASEIIRLGGDSEDAGVMFENWFRGGMEVLEYSEEGGRAYFALETSNALASVERAMSGVPLRQVIRTLKLFAQGMCGEKVGIEALPHSLVPDSESHQGSQGGMPSRARVSPDGTVIFLPALLRQKPSREENIRLYTVMTAHEAGHLEFGTYQVPLENLQDLAQALQTRYVRNEGSVEGMGVYSLGDIFAHYPQPRIIRDLWEILEDARVEYLLQQEYPGLRKDLALLVKEEVAVRSLLHGMTAREMVLDALLLSFSGEISRVRFPAELKPLVSRVWSMARTILRADATAEQAIRLADRLYQVLDEMIGSLRASDPNQWREQAHDQSDESMEVGSGPRASEETSVQYRPITNWSYRGRLDPDVVQGHSLDDESSGQDGPSELASSEISEGAPFQPSPKATDSLKAEQPHLEGRGQQETFSGSPLDHWLELEKTSKEWHRGKHASTSEHWYDEWDGTVLDYRPQWCRVVERVGKNGSVDFVDQTLEAYAPLVRLLRRYFEAIRPLALRRRGRQEHGEEVDLDAAVARVVDVRGGCEPSDRIYVRREKRERQVAVAFLLDMSGSTGRKLESGPHRVIDVEKQGLVLLSEALNAIGDTYALYGFSGQGRHHVDMVVLKDFEDSPIGRTALRIGAIQPSQQNRDGAAIRHATYRLLQQSARSRLLILISDGKPLDDGYGDEYSLEDTKMALREARMKGIHPFCITIDQAASGYLTRMYGEVGFLVVDNIADLPTRLPRIYQRLTA